MDSKFKIGDVVRLKSGSVAMTIEEMSEPADEEFFVKCTYWNPENFGFDDIEITSPDLLMLSNPDNFTKGA